MSESVKVAVRCRPMSEKEQLQKCRSVVTVDSGSRTCSLADKVYQFDAAFGPDASTETVYEELGSYVVEAVLHGYNGTVFAYGQTGCGKSHTMRGFVERALEHLFDAISTAGSDIRYLALLTYLEIYNEKLKDLLQPADSMNENQLLLKEDSVRGTYVAGGLREVQVKDARECGRLVEQGDRRRAAAATRMNAASSRSHAVLTISVEAIAIGPGAPSEALVRRGRLHLVDLAGSERQARTGATGDRLKEAASINLSLSALGNVISALAAGNGRHVPYRDSKLTRLLRDSLGGNARTLMIACVSPSDADADETLSTLRYAARARCIKNKPVVNEDPKDALLRQYQLELHRLRKLLESSGESDHEPRDNNGAQCTCAHEQPTNHHTPDLLVVESAESTTAGAAAAVVVSPTDQVADSEVCELDPEREERRRKKRELAKQEVMRRLERLTIGGESLGDAEVKRRRERRRKRLQALAQVLEKSSQEGNAGAFEVYGQLKSTEEALKRMAKKAKQLEAEAADLQASWDEERRELLRRELLAQQICEAMLPHLRPGCPLRDLWAVRSAATWSSELGRWRLPDVSSSSSRIPLPPASSISSPPPPAKHQAQPQPPAEPDLNNNDGSSPDENDRARQNIADVYFKRKRIDKILEHVREAKTFETSRPSKSSSSSEELQQLTPIGSNGAVAASDSQEQQQREEQPPVPRLVGGWLDELPRKPAVQQQQQQQQLLVPPPRILEALPAYPHMPRPQASARIGRYLHNNFVVPS